MLTLAEIDRYHATQIRDAALRRADYAWQIRMYQEEAFREYARARMHVDFGQPADMLIARACQANAAVLAGRATQMLLRLIHDRV